MASRDSLPANHQPDQGADPLIALVRLLARQAAAEALRSEHRHSANGDVEGTRTEQSANSHADALAPWEGRRA